MATVIPRLTKAGAILLAKAIAGQQLSFTRGAFGDANSQADNPADSQIDNFTALINERISLPIADFKIVNNQAVITLLVKNENVQSGFRIAEGGVFAYNPETDREILYAYFFDGDDGDFMPAPAASGMQLEYQYEFITAVANAQKVTAIIDKSTIGVMRDEFEEHINSADPHPNLDLSLNQFFIQHVDSADPHPNWDVVLHPEFNAHVDIFNEHVNSTDPHPNWKVQIYPGTGLAEDNQTLNVVPASETVLGGIKVGKNLYMTDDSLNADAASTDEFNARLKQIEINQANLYILLQEFYGLGNKSNLQLVEDYNPATATDFYSARVYTTPSKKYLRVFEPGYLRVGGHFTVTNGRLLQEQCQVKSFAKWGDYDTPYIANLGVALDNEYPSTLTNYLYRSTVTLRDNKAYGAGEILIRSQKKNRLWKGEGSSDSQTIEFNAYPSLESSFQLDGDWSLTADGYFALD